MTLRDAVMILGMCTTLAPSATVPRAQEETTRSQRVDSANRLFARFVEDAAVIPSFWLEGQAGYSGNQAAFLADAPGASQSDLLRAGPVFAFNVAEDFEFGARFSLAHRDPDVGDAETGLTDLDLWGKIAVVSEPVSVALGLLVTAPTGSEDRFLGTGETDVEVFAALRKDFAPVTLAGHVGARVNQDPDFPDVEIEANSSLLLGAAALFPAGRRLVLMVEWAFETERVDGSAADSRLLGGFEYRLDPGFAVRGAAGGGLSDGAPDVEATGSIVWIL